MKSAKGRVLFRVNIFLTHSLGALLTSPLSVFKIKFTSIYSFVPYDCFQNRGKCSI